MSGLKDLPLSPSLRAHGYLTLSENAQEEVRGGREEGKRVGERMEIMGEREGEREMEGGAGGRGRGKESINKGTCTCTCIT